MDKIIFFQMNQLGDLLFSLPILKTVREETDCEIYSVAPKNLAPILISSGLADYVFFKETKFLNLVKKLQKEKFKKAVCFSQSPKSLICAYCCGTKERIGFSGSGFGFLLTKKVKRVGVPSLFNNINLGFAAGLKDVHHSYTNILKVPLENLKSVKKWFKDNNLESKKTIAISIGSSRKRKKKCLKEHVWIETIKRLTEKNFNIVLCGAQWERRSLEKFTDNFNGKPLIFIPKTGILDTMAFLSRVGLFVGIDSGAMHLAAALGTKCIGVFSVTDPAQVGPLPFQDHIIIKKDTMDCITAQDLISNVEQNFKIS
jgi:heptosyltransferase-2